MKKGLLAFIIVVLSIVITPVYAEEFETLFKMDSELKDNTFTIQLGLREAKCGVCEDPKYWNEILARRWNNIKSDPKILEWAIQPLKYSIKCGEEEISVESVNGVSICESILLNYKEFIGENNIYQRLIKLIFPNDPHEHTIAKVRDYTVLEYYNAQPFLILALQNPDLVLSGGDYIKGHNGKSTMDIELISREIAKINAPVISVLGNHDGWYDKYRVKKALETSGIKVLSNSNTKIEDLYISGVEDLQTGIPNIETALENTENPRILLTHTPDIYYDIKLNDILFLLSCGYKHNILIYINEIRRHAYMLFSVLFDIFSLYSTILNVKSCCTI